MYANSPFAKSDDRWSKAMWIVEHGHYATRKRCDELTRRAVHYIRLLQRATTDRHVRSAAKKFPDIYLAMKVANEDSIRILEIKARLLAGQSNAEIAGAIGFPAPAVATFAALFFDVPEKLRAKTWIVRQAIGLPYKQVLSVQAIMLSHAYQRGPAVIEPWMDYLAHVGEKHDLNTEEGRQRAWIDLLVDVQQLPETEKVWKSLQRTCAFTASQSNKTVKKSTVQAAFCQNRAQMLQETALNDLFQGAVWEDSLAMNTALP